MVHRGPSKGCLKCKERRVKCDLERPQCKQCVKQKIKCPGYRHQLDVVLRDKTASIVGRYGDNQPKVTPDNQSHNIHFGFQLVPEITTSIEATAVFFLFDKVVMRPNKDWRTSHGHFDYILPLHQTAPATSSFAMATTWLALVLLGIYTRGAPHPREDEYLQKAVLKLSRAVSDTSACLTDETLATVIILQQGNNLRDQRYKHGLPSRLHQTGAEALIRKRGRSNFKNTVSASLFASARSNAIDFALQTGVHGSNWDLWEQHTAWADLQILFDRPALQLDTLAVRLVALKTQVETTGWTGNRTWGETVDADLNRFLDELRSWDSQLPVEWLPIKESRFVHHYVSKDVAYLFAQWYLMRLDAQICLMQLHINEIQDFPDMISDELDLMGELIETVIATQGSILGLRLQMMMAQQPLFPSLTGSDEAQLPFAMVGDCIKSVLGSRFLVKILDILIFLLEKISKQMSSIGKEMGSLNKHLDWAKREQLTLRLAYPSRNV